MVEVGGVDVPGSRTMAENVGQVTYFIPRYDVEFQGLLKKNISLKIPQLFRDETLF